MTNKLIKYSDNPLKAIEVAVNHPGDSDSTGSLIGQIVGVAQTTNDWLPQKYFEKLELHDLISQIGDTLAKKLT